MVIEQLKSDVDKCQAQAKRLQKNLQDSHATLQLWAHLLIHFDQTTAVINEHAVQLALLNVHPEDKIQLLGFLQRPVGDKKEPEEMLKIKHITGWC